jgi:3-hydroxyisobutyrate dehydrogenase-like beta-hydroxyacid dehydrogenase
MSGTIGVIGLGIMGSAMSGNLLAAGFRVVGCDPDPARRDAFAAKGGVPADTPAAVARDADRIILSLPSVAAFDQVVSGADGLVSAARDGLIVIETGTLPIDVKERGRDAVAGPGAVMLDCPLSGTGAQAVTRDLAVYASGDEAAYRRCIEVFEGFARAHYHVGPFGNGSRMKFVANHLVAIHNVAAAEAMVLGMKAGLDAELIYRVIGDGAGSSRMFEVRGPMMVADDYSEATMKIEVWQKDMSIIGAFAGALDCPVPLFAASGQVYNAAMAQGHARDDTAAVCAVMQEMARLQRK